MVDDKRTQWTDTQFDAYKKIIDDEIETIKQTSKCKHLYSISAYWASKF
jgi:hypothetical protein